MDSRVGCRALPGTPRPPCVPVGKLRPWEPAAPAQPDTAMPSARTETRHQRRAARVQGPGQTPLEPVLAPLSIPACFRLRLCSGSVLNLASFSALQSRRAARGSQRLRDVGEHPGRGSRARVGAAAGTARARPQERAGLGVRLERVSAGALGGPEARGTGWVQEAGRGLPSLLQPLA